MSLKYRNQFHFLSMMVEKQCPEEFFFQSNIVLTFKENNLKFRKCLSKLRIIPSRNKYLFIFEIQVIEIRTKSRKTACCETCERLIRHLPRHRQWLQSSVRSLLINLSLSICRVRIPNSNFLIPLFHTGHESPESIFY